MAAARCLSAAIPLGADLAESRQLQQQTRDASQLPLSLVRVSDLSAPLAACTTADPASPPVLHAQQLAAIATTVRQLLSARQTILSSGAALTTSELSAPTGLEALAARVSPQLADLADRIARAVDTESGMVLDRASAALADVRAARRTNAAALANELDHWCRELHRQGASDLRAPVIRRGRLCCSVRRGRSGVRLLTVTTAAKPLCCTAQSTCGRAADC
jgi:hypothetical protein